MQSTDPFGGIKVGDIITWPYWHGQVFWKWMIVENLVEKTASHSKYTWKEIHGRKFAYNGVYYSPGVCSQGGNHVSDYKFPCKPEEYDSGKNFCNVRVVPELEVPPNIMNALVNGKPYSYL